MRRAKSVVAMLVCVTCVVSVNAQSFAQQFSNVSSSRIQRGNAVTLKLADGQAPSTPDAIPQPAGAKQTAVTSNLADEPQRKSTAVFEKIQDQTSRNQPKSRVPDSQSPDAIPTPAVAKQIAVTSNLADEPQRKSTAVFEKIQDQVPTSRNQPELRVPSRTPSVAAPAAPVINVRTTPVPRVANLPHQQSSRRAITHSFASNPIQETFQSPPAQIRSVDNSPTLSTPASARKPLTMQEVAGIKFADPKGFLQSGDLKFTDPNEFLSSHASPQGQAATQPKRLVPAKMASSPKKIPMQDRQPNGTQVEPLTSIPLTQPLSQPLSPAPQQDQATASIKLTDATDKRHLTVSDVHAPIRMDPFSGIVQDDSRGVIVNPGLSSVPIIVGQSYSEVTGLPFEPHFAGWSAPNFKHRPLYFEEVNLERYGNQLKYQNLFSAAHFLGSAAILPYKMGQEPPNSCISTLGHRRPGECVPYQIHRLPFSRKALFNQALTVTALSL